jgi:hypothetical protein
MSRGREAALDENKQGVTKKSVLFAKKKSAGRQNLGGAGSAAAGLKGLRGLRGMGRGKF